MFGIKRPHEDYALSVRLGKFDAGVIGAAGSKLTVLFSERSSPPLCIGEKVKLQFLDGGTLHGREAQARVISWHDRGIHREVEFRLPAEVVVLAAGGMGLRDDFRVVPNPADRLVAKVRARGRTEWQRTLLKDLSLTGIGVLVSSETDGALVETSLVEVELDLPGIGQSLPFIGRIRSRCMAGCTIRHGIEIVPKMTEGHAFLEESLRAYSLQRQKELIGASRLLSEPKEDARRSA